MKMKLERPGFLPVATGSASPVGLNFRPRMGANEREYSGSDKVSYSRPFA
jgi:hypothetical protein